MADRSFKINILVTILTFILLLAAGELFFRVFQPQIIGGYRPSSNDRLVYELIPGRYMREMGAYVSCQGLNDEVYGVEKPEGVCRIAIVGDSASFGWKVDRSRSFPSLLEALLEKSGRGLFEIINFSVPGYNTAQETELIRQTVLEAGADMVILVYSGNDIHLCNFIKSRSTPFNYFYNHSFFTRYILHKFDYLLYRLNFIKGLRYAWAGFKENILGVYYKDYFIYPYPGLEIVPLLARGHNPPLKRELVPEDYWYMLGHANYARHLKEIRSLLRERGAAFISSGHLNGAVLKGNREIGVRHIASFDEVLSHFPIETTCFSRAELHLNEEGHRIIAEYLYDYLEENFLKEGLLCSNP